MSAIIGELIATFTIFPLIDIFPDLSDVVVDFFEGIFAGLLNFVKDMAEEHVRPLLLLDNPMADGGVRNAFTYNLQIFPDLLALAIIAALFSYPFARNKPSLDEFILKLVKVFIFVGFIATLAEVIVLVNNGLIVHFWPEDQTITRIGLNFHDNVAGLGSATAAVIGGIIMTGISAIIWVMFYLSLWLRQFIFDATVVLSAVFAVAYVVDFGPTKAVARVPKTMVQLTVIMVFAGIVVGGLVQVGVASYGGYDTGGQLQSPESAITAQETLSIGTGAAGGLSFAETLGETPRELSDTVNSGPASVLGQSGYTTSESFVTDPTTQMESATAPEEFVDEFDNQEAIAEATEKCRNTGTHGLSQLGQELHTSAEVWARNAEENANWEDWMQGVREDMRAQSGETERTSVMEECIMIEAIRESGSLDGSYQALIENRASREDTQEQPVPPYIVVWSCTRAEDPESAREMFVSGSVGNTPISMDNMPDTIPRPSELDSGTAVNNEDMASWIANSVEPGNHRELLYGDSECRENAIAEFEDVPPFSQSTYYWGLTKGSVQMYLGSGVDEGQTATVTARTDTGSARCTFGEYATVCNRGSSMINTFEEFMMLMISLFSPVVVMAYSMLAVVGPAGLMMSRGGGGGGGGGSSRPASSDDDTPHASLREQASGAAGKFKETATQIRTGEPSEGHQEYFTAGSDEGGMVTSRLPDSAVGRTAELGGGVVKGGMKRAGSAGMYMATGGISQSPRQWASSATDHFRQNPVVESDVSTNDGQPLSFKNRFWNKHRSFADGIDNGPVVAGDGMNPSSSDLSEIDVEDGVFFQDNDVDSAEWEEDGTQYQAGYMHDEHGQRFLIVNKGEDNQMENGQKYSIEGTQVSRIGDDGPQRHSMLRGATAKEGGYYTLVNGEDTDVSEVKDDGTKVKTPASESGKQSSESSSQDGTSQISDVEPSGSPIDGGKEKDVSANGEGEGEARAEQPVSDVEPRESPTDGENEMESKQPTSQIEPKESPAERDQEEESRSSDAQGDSKSITEVQPADSPFGRQEGENSVSSNPPTNDEPFIEPMSEPPEQKEGKGRGTPNLPEDTNSTPVKKDNKTVSEAESSQDTDSPPVESNEGGEGGESAENNPVDVLTDHDGGDGEADS